MCQNANVQNCQNKLFELTPKKCTITTYVFHGCSLFSKLNSSHIDVVANK